jgi:C4-dicarboxylate-specific signal transduction histidine kinase
VQVTFADRGRGFSPKALQHFTEFFFSEKEGGMGIGLSVAAEILKAHGGSLTAANRPDGGALVTVDLPTTPPAA